MSVRGARRADAPRPHIRFIDVLRNRDFAVLYVAEMQSLAGDQLARVALSVLVFDSTKSASITAATYAATFLPAILGGYLVARVGDHVPRRVVMIGCDVLRALCFGAMATPGLPVAGVIAFVVLAVFIGPAFSASEVSYLAARLSPARFGVANALRLSSSQVAQVGGFAIGGLLVDVLGARGALGVDAGTYALSALLIGMSLRNRSGLTPELAGSNAGSAVSGSVPFVGLWRDARVRPLLALALLAGLFVVPEGLAVPYGRSLGASSAQIGLLLASGALGGAIGAALLMRLPMSHRSGVAEWMAVACGLPLAAIAVTHHLPVAILCWFASGLCGAYIVQLITVIVQHIPDARRAHLVGIVASLLLGSQGIGLLIFGVAVRLVSPGTAIAAAGAIGSGCALALVLGPLHRTQPLMSTGSGVRSAVK